MYRGGQLAAREYFTPEARLLSRERFDADGYITAWVMYRQDGTETRRWEYDRGTPIREIRAGAEYVKRGDRFGCFQAGSFVETPRGSLSR